MANVQNQANPGTRGKKPPAESTQVRHPSRARAPEGETKRDKFRRLAAPRASLAIRALERLEFLARPGYEFTSEELDKLETAIAGAYDRTMTALRRRLDAPTRAPAKARQAFTWGEPGGGSAQGSPQSTAGQRRH